MDLREGVNCWRLLSAGCRRLAGSADNLVNYTPISMRMALKTASPRVHQSYGQVPQPAMSRSCEVTTRSTQHSQATLASMS